MLFRSPDQPPFYASSITLNAVQESYRCPANATVPAQVLDRVRDATELVSLCQNPALCQAFTIGVIDSHQAFADSKIIRPMVCMPDQAEIRDAMLTVITYRLIGTVLWDLQQAAAAVRGGKPPSDHSLIQDPPVEWFCLSGAAVGDIDYTGAAAIRQLIGLEEPLARLALAHQLQQFVQ